MGDSRARDCEEYLYHCWLESKYPYREEGAREAVTKVESPSYQRQSAKPDEQDSNYGDWSGTLITPLGKARFAPG
jgi:hypothetical protein